ncbi:MAG: hypothetical protein RR646_02915 [Erysipelotrichaceae bacterium]
MKNIFNEIDKKQRIFLGSIVCLLIMMFIGFYEENHLSITGLFKEEEVIDLTTSIDLETYKKNIKKIDKAQKDAKYSIKIDLIDGQVNTIKNADKKGYYFLVPIYGENEKLMALPIKAYDKDRNMLIEQARKTEAYYISNGEKDIPQTIMLKGVFRKVDFSNKDEILEYINGDITDEDIIEMTNNQFNVNDYGNGSKNSLIKSILWLSGITICIIILIYRIIIKGRSKAVKRKLIKLGYDNEEIINLNYEEGTKLKGIVFGRDLLICLSLTKTIIIPYNNILNTYMYKNKLNGLTIIKYIIVLDSLGNEYHIGNYVSKKSFDDISSKMYEMNHSIIFGYDAYTVSLIKSNPKESEEYLKQVSEEQSGFEDITKEE